MAVVLFYVLTAREVLLTEEERGLVVDVAHLARFVHGCKPNPAHERLSKQRYVDRSYDIEYEYEAPEGESPLFLTSSLSVENTPKDARETYLMCCGLAKASFVVAGGEGSLEARHEMFRWGDQSRCWLLMVEGRPAGNVFIAQRGRCVFYVMVSGAVFPDRQSLSCLLSPVLQRVERYRP